MTELYQFMNNESLLETLNVTFAPDNYTSRNQEYYIFDKVYIRIIFILLYSVVFCLCFFGKWKFSFCCRVFLGIPWSLRFSCSQYVIFFRIDLNIQITKQYRIPTSEILLYFMLVLWSYKYIFKIMYNRLCWFR